MAKAREIIELELDLARGRDEEIPGQRRRARRHRDHYRPGRVVEPNG